jgi:hypothetical protein
MRSRSSAKAAFGAVIALTATLFVSSPAGAKPRCGPNDLPVFGPGASYRPIIDPARFGPNVDNPRFPLSPGTTFIYSGTKDAKKALDVFAVTSRTATVDGVTTRVIEDRLFLDSVLEERTTDYYAQDDCGNVWYFGEDTATLDEHGRVISTKGSFRAGIDGAQPGVFVEATPELHRPFRQEWYQGQAEDVFKAINLSASVSVPYGKFQHALETKETTALEPSVVDHKYYVLGIGEVEELSVAGPVEKLELIDVIR